MDKRSTWPLLLLILGGALLSGCAAGEVQAYREYKLFCGMSSRNGEVSEAAWRRFCERCVAAAFPDGYTVFDAAGCWRTESGAAANERTKVILIVAPAADRDKVLAVAKRYREEFGQESVLISASAAEMEVVRAADGNEK